MALIVLLIHSVGFAQPKTNDWLRHLMQNTTPEERADFQTDKMRELLNLSNEQTEQVRAINRKYAREMERIYKSEASILTKFNKLRKIRDQKQNELKSVLDLEQYKKYEAEKKEIMKQMEQMIKNEQCCDMLLKNTDH
jgi:hypothetical protein